MSLFDYLACVPPPPAANVFNPPPCQTGCPAVDNPCTTPVSTLISSTTAAWSGTTVPGWFGIVVNNVAPGTRVWTLQSGRSVVSGDVTITQRLDPDCQVSDNGNQTKTLRELELSSSVSGVLVVNDVVSTLSGGQDTASVTWDRYSGTLVLGLRLTGLPSFQDGGKNLLFFELNISDAVARPPLPAACCAVP